jgi:hypothetical protein
MPKKSWEEKQQEAIPMLGITEEELNILRSLNITLNHIEKVTYHSANFDVALGNIKRIVHAEIELRACVIP